MIASDERLRSLITEAKRDDTFEAWVAVFREARRQGLDEEMQTPCRVVLVEWRVRRGELPSAPYVRVNLRSLRSGLITPIDMADKSRSLTSFRNAVGTLDKARGCVLYHHTTIRSFTRWEWRSVIFHHFEVPSFL